MKKRRLDLLERIRKDAEQLGVEVNWEHMKEATFPQLQFVSIVLQLHSGK